MQKKPSLPEIWVTNYPANKSPDGNVATMLPFGRNQIATLQQHCHQVTRLLGSHMQCCHLVETKWQHCHQVTCLLGIYTLLCFLVESYALVGYKAPVGAADPQQCAPSGQLETWAENVRNSGREGLWSEVVTSSATVPGPDCVIE